MIRYATNRKINITTSELANIVTKPTYSVLI